MTHTAAADDVHSFRRPLFIIIHYFISVVLVVVRVFLVSVNEKKSLQKGAETKFGSAFSPYCNKKKKSQKSKPYDY